jgi:uncharacterized membrane protein (UPF0182 family)
VVLVLIGLVWLMVLAADQYADWRWFDHLGHADVLARRWAVGGLLVVLVAGLSAAALCGNLLLARRLSGEVRAPAAARLDAELRAFLEQVSAGLGDTEPRTTRRGGEAGRSWHPESPNRQPRDRLGSALLFGTALVSVILGLRAGGWTEVVLRWWNGAPFGVREPLFGRDVSAYVFVLPVVRPLVGWLLVLSILALGVVSTLYVAQAMRATPSGFDRQQILRGLGLRPRIHVGVLGACVLLAIAASLQVARAELVFSTRGRAVGVGFPGFADMQVQSPAYVLMSLMAVIAGLLLVVAARRGERRLAIRPLIAFGLVLLGGWLLPLLVQVFIVLPNDVDLERAYLGQTIRLTRQAFGLEGLQDTPPPPPTALPADPSSLPDVPLWGRAAIDSNLNQLQALRPYYAFSSTQPDRYTLDGQARLLLVGARELNPDGLPSRSWSAIHLQYTHGYGTAIALADEATPDGAPALVDNAQLPVDRPEIYFGQRTATYAVVKTTQEEQDTLGRYAGQGVGLGGGLARFTFAVALRDLSLLFSQSVTGDSELLFHRQVLERVTRLAPFLQPDPEPYLVVDGGRLVWIVDAYTTTADYPGVQRRLLGAPDAPRLSANYMRNSVKASVDAYDGSVRLFVSDPDDPLIRAEAAAYPGLLEPLAQMPPGLRAHLRYPRLLLATQSDVLTRFHDQDATSFARGEDAWRVPEDQFNARLDGGPSFVLLRAPGDPAGGELALVQPFSPFDPSGTQGSLVGLLLARADGLVLQRYPREAAVPGPLDVDRRIDQQPDIAAQFADWQRGGARVLRGKAVPIPFGPQPMYAEAIYLQRGVAPIMPQLQRVVAALDTRVVMEPTLGGALERLRAGQD